jgi:hypothetical protein
MNLKISFGLPEILGIFGCYGIITNSYLAGSLLLFSSIIGILFRTGLEIQSRKENSEKLQNAFNTFVDTFFQPNQNFWNSSNDKNDIH